MAKDRVGFIGLGVMGKPMARNLMEAGHELVLFSRTRASVDEVAGDSATAADSPREVAEQADAVVLMLPDSPQVRDVLDGDDGLLAGAREGSLVIDMSTISPVVTREIAEECGGRGIGWGDAPVSGGGVGARGGTLSIMAGAGAAPPARGSHPPRSGGAAGRRPPPAQSRSSRRWARRSSTSARSAPARSS